MWISASLLALGCLAHVGASEAATAPAEGSLAQPVLDRNPPLEVEPANAALRVAASCIRNQGKEAVAGTPCAELFSVSSDRVRIHDVVLKAEGGWKHPVEVLQPDGSWLMLETSNDGAFHSVLWVESAQLYLGYVSWYGEYGCFLVVLPGDDKAVQVAGVPVFSPDGKQLVGAEFDTWHSNLELSVLDIEGTTATEKLRRRYQMDTYPELVEKVTFVGDRWLQLDLNDQGVISPAWIDRRTQELQTAQSAYESSVYGSCDAKVLAELWGLPTHETKMRVGSKLITGEGAKVKSEIERAFLRPGRVQCDLDDSDVSDGDRQVLQSLWGGTLQETNARIVVEINQGQQAQLNALVAQAKQTP